MSKFETTTNQKLHQKMSLYVRQERDLILDGTDKEYVLKVKDLPEEEKPREKLAMHGPSVMSVNELLAIVFNVGTRKEGVLAMSSRILQEYGEKAIVNETDPKRIGESLDIPISKACQLVACFELGRRFFEVSSSAKPTVMRTAKQVYEYLKDMHDLPKEHLRGMYVNSRYRMIHDEVISIGSLTANIVHPREVFRPALEHSASAVILAHNHPSGIAKPSREDIEITKQLVGAGKILGVHLLDHIVVSKDAFVSIPVDYN